MVNANNIDNTCFEHGTSFAKYCKNCSKNICPKCQRSGHQTHRLIDLADIFPGENDIQAAQNLCKERNAKLEEVKKGIKEWLKEVNKRTNDLLELIDGDIIINNNILKDFKTDFMNYQMVQNFRYFSERKSFSNQGVVDFLAEDNFLSKSVKLLTALDNIYKDFSLDSEKKKLPIEKLKSGGLSKVMTLQLNTPNSENVFQSSKTLSSFEVMDISQFPTFKESLGEKGIYWNINHLDNISINKGTVKANIDIKDNISCVLLDNKGVLFIAGESGLDIYCCETKKKTVKIEKEFSIKMTDGEINSILEIKNDYLVIGNNNNTIRIIKFMGNKKYMIHQEIIFQDASAILKVIELSNYHLLSCGEDSVVMYEPLNHGYYEVCDELDLKYPTNYVLQIKKDLVAMSHLTKKKLSFYEISNQKFKLIKEIEKIESELVNNSMVLLDDVYFILSCKNCISLFSIEKLELVKKFENKPITTCMLPVNYGVVLTCNYIKKEGGKYDYNIVLTCFDEKNKITLEIEKNTVIHNTEQGNDILYANLVENKNLVIVSKKSIKALQL